HTVLFDLKPVALPHGRGAGVKLVTWQLKGIQKREDRPPFRGSHVGKDQPAVFVQRVSAMKEPVLKRAVSGFSRCLKDCAIDIEQPTVIAASDTLFADQPKLKRGAPVRAVQFQ